MDRNELIYCAAGFAVGIAATFAFKAAKTLYWKKKLRKNYEENMVRDLSDPVVKEPAPQEEFKEVHEQVSEVLKEYQPTPDEGPYIITEEEFFEGEGVGYTYEIAYFADKRFGVINLVENEVDPVDPNVIFGNVTDDVIKAFEDHPDLDVVYVRDEDKEVQFEVTRDYRKIEDLTSAPLLSAMEVYEE